MAASSDDISRLRRMVSEPEVTTYVDGDLSSAIESYPIEDSAGNEPDDDDWTATYDLHAAAADIWQEKAGRVITDYDFQADGGRYDRSQVHSAMMKQVHHHLARRQLRAIVQKRWIPVTDEDDD